MFLTINSLERNVQVFHYFEIFVDTIQLSVMYLFPSAIRSVWEQHDRHRLDPNKKGPRKKRTSPKISSRRKTDIVKA